MTRIKLKRILSGLSQKKFSEVVGVSQPTAWSWEAGKTFPAAKYWDIIKKVLKVEHIEDLKEEKKHEAS